VRPALVIAGGIGKQPGSAMHLFGGRRFRFRLSIHVNEIDGSDDEKNEVFVDDDDDGSEVD